MARIRTIKPELPHSESLGRVTRDARLLFTLLLPYVDDEGRNRGASQLLASLLFPYDKDASDLIDGWLAELEREDCIVRYEADGISLIQVKNWLKHQKIDHPTKSKFPPPSGYLAKPREALAKVREDVASVAETLADPRASRARAGPKDLGSGSRTKDPDPGKGEEGNARAFSREGEGEEANWAGDANPAGWPADYRDQFEALYPNKVAMAVGLKALDAARASGGVSWRVVIAALEAYATKTDDRAFCNPKTWIEQERWNDRPAKPAGNGAHPPGKSAGGGERARRLAREMEARERQEAGGGAPDAIGGDELGGEHARLVSGRKGPTG